MKKIVLSLALSIVFACCACMPVAAADVTSEDWQRTDGPYEKPGTEDVVSGRLILTGGRAQTVGEAVEKLQSVAGDDMEPAVYRDGEPLDDSDVVASGDTVNVGTSAEPLGIVVRGDATSTGTPGLRQVIQIAKALRGEADLTGAQAEAADANGSGKLDLGDVVLAARYMQVPQDEEAMNAAARSATAVKKTTTAAKTTATATPEPESNLTKFSKTVLEGTNAIRAKNSVKPALKKSDKLSQAAQVRADELAKSGVLSHTRPDGSKYSTVCTVAKGLVVGENIHCNKGYPLTDTAKVAMEGWENSSAHLKQMLEPRYSHIGTGFAQAKDGTWYCVQLFSNGDNVLSIDKPKA